MTVYLVESGEYSDRAIVGVFSTYEKAERYIAHLKHDDMWESTYRIMDYKVDNFTDNNTEIWYKYNVCISNNGHERHYITDITPIYKSDVEHDKINRYGDNSIGYKYIGFVTYHKDRELSMKSIEDRYAKTKAEEMLL